MYLDLTDVTGVHRAVRKYPGVTRGLREQLRLHLTTPPAPWPGEAAPLHFDFFFSSKKKKEKLLPCSTGYGVVQSKALAGSLARCPQPCSACSSAVALVDTKAPPTTNRDSGTWLACLSSLRVRADAPLGPIVSNPQVLKLRYTVHQIERQ